MDPFGGGRFRDMFGAAFGGPMGQANRQISQGMPPGQGGMAGNTGIPPQLQQAIASGQLNGANPGRPMGGGYPPFSPGGPRPGGPPGGFPPQMDPNFMQNLRIHYPGMGGPQGGPPGGFPPQMDPGLGRLPSPPVLHAGDPLPPGGGKAPGPMPAIPAWQQLRQMGIDPVGGGHLANKAQLAAAQEPARLYASPSGGIFAGGGQPQKGPDTAVPMAQNPNYQLDPNAPQLAPGGGPQTPVSSQPVAQPRPGAEPAIRNMGAPKRQAPHGPVRNPVAKATAPPPTQPQGLQNPALRKRLAGRGALLGGK
jgi:hypothetical protein